MEVRGNIGLESNIVLVFLWCLLYKSVYFVQYQIGMDCEADPCTKIIPRVAA